MFIKKTLDKQVSDREENQGRSMANEGDHLQRFLEIELRVWKVESHLDMNEPVFDIPNQLEISFGDDANNISLTTRMDRIISRVTEKLKKKASSKDYSVPDMGKDLLSITSQMKEINKILEA